MNRALIILPIILTMGAYTANFARIFSLSVWLLWLQAGLFILLCSYVLAALTSYVVLPKTRRFLVAGMILGLVGLVGSSPIARFVIAKQDQHFMQMLSHYHAVVAWVEEHGGASPTEDQFPQVSYRIEVRNSSIAGTEVFFLAYPGPLGTRLRGYAYSSADRWSENFIKVYGVPKKLTNHWYRI